MIKHQSPAVQIVCVMSWLVFFFFIFAKIYGDDIRWYNLVFSGVLALIMLAINYEAKQ